MEKEKKVSELFREWNRDFTMLKGMVKAMKETKEAFEEIRTKTYRLITKTNTQAPEFEIEVKAESRDEAINKIVDGYDISREVCNSNLQQI